MLLAHTENANEVSEVHDESDKDNVNLIFCYKFFSVT